MCSPVWVDSSDEVHGDRVINEVSIGHADLECLRQNERRIFLCQNASTLDWDIFFKVKKLTAPSNTPLGLNSCGAVTV